MKTAVTISNTIQTGIDDYRDIRVTKIFDDSATLLDIKTWIRSYHNNRQEISKISLSKVFINDVVN